MAKELAAPISEKIMGYDKWEVDGWLRTMMEFQALSKDPKKMKAVEKLARMKKKELNSIADLKERYNDLVEEEKEDA